MGRSIIDYHLGAYFKIDMSENEYYEKLDELGFYSDYEADGTGAKYENFNYEKFRTIETPTILLPYGEKDKPVCNIEIEYNCEFEYDGSEDLSCYETNLKALYAEQIKIMEDIFGKKMKIKTGLVAYADEIA